MKKFVLGSLLTLAFCTFVEAQTCRNANLEMAASATGAVNPTTNGPSVADQVIALRNNTNDPGGTTFSNFVPAVTATYSLSNQQYTGVTGLTGAYANGIVYGSNGAGSTGSLLYATMGSLGSANATNFSSSPSNIGSGINLTANYGVELKLGTRILQNVSAPLTGSYYYGDLTITFNQAVDYPILQMADLGEFNGTHAFAMQAKLISGQTLTRLSGDAAVTLVGTDSISAAVSGTTATTNFLDGSFMVNGTGINSITLKLYLKGFDSNPSWSPTTAGANGREEVMIGITIPDLVPNQPAATSSSLIKFCPAETVNLNSVLPAAVDVTSFEFHNVATAPSSGSLISNSSTYASTGPVYLFAKDIFTGCYSPTGDTVTVVQNSADCGDCDLDGVLNYADIDDDNDGVLDVNENATSTAIWSNMPNGGTSGSGTLNTPCGPNPFTVTTTTNLVAGMSNSVTINSTATTTDNNACVFSTTNYSPALPSANTIGFNFQGLVNLTQPAGTVCINFAQPIKNPILYYSNIDGAFWDFSPTAGLDSIIRTAGSPQFAVDSNVVSLGFGGSSNNFLNCTVAGQTAGGYGSARLIGTFTSICAKIFKKTASGGIIDVTTFNIATDYNDCDGDGNSNSCDLDSDGDSCGDAKEAGAIPTTSTASSFAGPVDSNGLSLAVPTYTSSYPQYANDSSINYCNLPDCDNDGIANVIDIDDDNDGILDDIEGCSTASIVNNGDFSAGNSGWTFTNFASFANEASYTYNSQDAAAPDGTLSQNLTGLSSVVNPNGYIAVKFDFTPINNSPANVLTDLRLNGVTYASIMIPQTVGAAATISSSNGAIINPAISSLPNNTATTVTVLIPASGIPNTTNLAFNITNCNSCGLVTDDLKLDNVSISCFIDTDLDGIPNSCDTDSDSDGCPDAYEAGASISKTALTVAGPYGLNGLANSIENNDSLNASTTYSSTYETFGLDSTSAWGNKCNLPDCDNDGVLNIFDLDSDNDGVLDIIENPTPVAEYTNFPNGGNSGTGSLSNGCKTINFSLTTTGGVEINNTATSTATNVCTWDNTDYNPPVANGNAIGIRMAGAANATAGTIKIKFSEPIKDPIIYFSNNDHKYWDFAPTPGITTISRLSGNASFLVQGTRLGRLDQTTTATNNNFLQCTPQAGGPGLPGRGTARINGTFDSLMVDVIGLNGAIDLTSINIAANLSCDNDGDGIPNTCDTDDDGDGCPTAYEAGASASKTSLTIAGPYGFNGLANSLEINDSSTATTTYNSYYSAYALDSSSNGNLCNFPDCDNDGIANVIDIDDDNDGVLDTLESPTITLMYTGADQVITAPANAIGMIVKAWGAGGGHEIVGGPTKYGGVGGYTTATFNSTVVTSGAQFSVVVGAGGNIAGRPSETAPVSVYGFGAVAGHEQGGGLSGVFTGNATVTETQQNRALVIAGAGSGYENSSTGTGTEAYNGNSPTSGGVVASMRGSTDVFTTSGCTPLPTSAHFGSGGGGYQGGGRIATLFTPYSNVFGSCGSNIAAARGGSGFVSPLTTQSHLLFTPDLTVNTPPMTNDPNYTAGVGIGGSVTSTAGGNGLVIITWLIDTDGDGLPNACDTDDDGDACPTAYEAGATSNPVQVTISGPYGLNGLANNLENNDSLTATVNYTVTYSNALDTSIHNCLATSIPDTVFKTPTCPTCPVSQCATADDLPTGPGTITYSTCGVSPSGFGTQVQDPTTGCITFTPNGTQGPNDTVKTCVVACKNGVCDTTYIIIPPVVEPDTQTVTPACPTCPVTECPTADDLPTGPGTITYSTCGVSPSGFGTQVQDPTTGCITFTPNGTQGPNDTVKTCVVACKNGVCDTTYIIIPPVVEPDTQTVTPACPTCPVTECPTADDLPIGPGTITYSTCGVSPSGFGTQVQDPTTGCITFTPNGTQGPNDTVTTCAVACKNGICDTTYVIINPSVKPDSINTTPNCPTCTTDPLCATADDLPAGPGAITYTSCGLPSGTNGSLSSINPVTGCMVFTGTALFVNDTVETCIVACKNGICDTTYITIYPPIPPYGPDTVEVQVPCPTCPISQCPTADDLPNSGTSTYQNCGLDASEATQGTLTIDANGCAIWTPNGTQTDTITTCIVICKGGVCDTTHLVILPPPVPDTVTRTPTCTTCPLNAICPTADDLPLYGTVTYQNCGLEANELSQGTLTVDVNGCVTWTPNGAQTDTITTCVVKCINGICDTTFIVIPPIPMVTLPDVNVTYVDVPVTGDVSTNDENVPNGSTYGNPAPNPANPGSATPSINPDGTYSFTSPIPGVFTFKVPIVTPDGDTILVDLTITVLDPDPKADNPPVANVDLAKTLPATPVTLPTLVNDKPGNPASPLIPSSVTVIDPPSNGTFAVDPVTGDITYTPNAGFSGKDTLRYYVLDADGDTAWAEQIIDVLPPNAPNTTAATDDYASTPYEKPVSGNALINDNDPEGDAQGVVPQTTTIPGKGTIVILPNGSYTFTPAPGFVGPVEFPYTVFDNDPTNPDTTMATIHILVAPVDPKPNPDVNTTWANIPVSGDVSTNDNYIPAGSTYGNPAPNPTNPGGAIPVINPDGSYTFTSPIPGVFNFQVPIVTPSGDTLLVDLQITVLDSASNANPPSANTDIATTAKNTPVSLNTLANDVTSNTGTGVGLNPSTVTVVDAPKNGTTTVDPLTGKITYTPNNGFVGVDTLKYSVQDSLGNTVTAYQIITIVDTAASPNTTTATDDYNAVTSTSEVSGDALNNDTDAEGDGQTVIPQTTTIPGKGTLVLNADGTYTFTPVPGYVGPVSFPYEVRDARGAAADATIYFIVDATSAPLSLVYANFEVSSLNCQVKLSWSIINNASAKTFEIFESENGANFVSVGSIKRLANQVDYNYEVDTRGSKTLYYYIKAIDENAAYSNSEVKKINLDCVENISIVGYPNPVTDQLFIEIKNLNADETGVVIVRDPIGKIVRRIDANLIANQVNLLYVDMSNMAPALYNVEVRLSGQYPKVLQIRKD